MNNFGNSPGGMKRPLSDPRQRLQQQGRFGHGRGQQQHFPPRHQQPMRRPGPGGPPQHGRGGGRGYQPPPGAPGRGFPMHHQHQQQQQHHQNQQQPGQHHHMGHVPVQQQHQQHQFQSGPGRGGFLMNRGKQAPPPPPPQQHAPFRPSPAMNNSHNRMHNTPPQPNMGAGYGQHVSMNPMGLTPSHRQPYQNQNQHGNPQHHQQHQYSPHSPPPGRHPQSVQQQPGIVPSYHSPQHQQHQQNHFQHSSSTNQYSHSSGQPPLHNHHVSQQQQQQQQQRATYTSISSSPIPKTPVATAQPYNAGASAATQPNTNASTSYTKAQIDQAWSEHNNKGVKYYHNSILQTSTYEKPQALMTSQEIVQQQQQQRQAAQAQHANNQQKAAVGPATVSAQTTASSSSSGAWTEYTDAKTGKKYYSDGVTTSWEKPAGFVSASAIVAQSNAAEEKTQQQQRQHHQESSSAKKKRKVHQRETPFRNSDEAVAAFKGLLLAKGVSPTQKWNEVVKMCSSDARWDDCEAVLTTGERKQGLAEYQTKRFNELKDQERQERARAKDAFSKLLSEVLPKLPAFSVLKTRFSDIRDSISKDDRFYAVPTESDRETLYLDFCEELRKHDERKKRNKKREAQDSFCLFLKEKEEAGILKFSSTWNSFLSFLSHAEREDSRFKVSSAMSDPDRQLYFADFVIELQAQEDDKRRRIRDARRRAEKAQRDAYRDALERIGTEGEVTPSSHWRDVQRLMEGDSSYESVLEQDRDAPREIFEEFIDEWDDIYRRDRQFLSQLVHPSSNREILVTRDTKYDAFIKALLEEANNSPQTYAEARRIMKSEEPRSSARLYFDELVNKAKEKAALPYRRRSYGSRRGAPDEDSSEDEGEIIEDGEAEDKKEVNRTEEPISEQSPDNGNRVEGSSENAPTGTSEETALKTSSSMDQPAVDNTPSTGDGSVEKLSSANVEEKVDDKVPAPLEEEAAANTTNPKEAVDDKIGNLALQANAARAAKDNCCDEQGHPPNVQTPCNSADGSDEKDSMLSAIPDKTGESPKPSQTASQARSAEVDLAADRTETLADAAMKDNEKDASRVMEDEATVSNQPTSNESIQGKETANEQQRTPDLTAAADEISAAKVEHVVDNGEAPQGAFHTTSEATEQNEPVQEPPQIAMHSSPIAKSNEGSSSELCIPTSELVLPTSAESSQSALPNLTNEALDDPRMVAMAAQSVQSASNVEEATEEDALYLQAFLTDEAPDEIEALQHHTMGMPS